MIKKVTEGIKSTENFGNFTTKEPFRMDFDYNPFPMEIRIIKIHDPLFYHVGNLEITISGNYNKNNEYETREFPVVIIASCFSRDGDEEEGSIIYGKKLKSLKTALAVGNSLVDRAKTGVSVPEFARICNELRFTAVAKYDVEGEAVFDKFEKFFGVSSY